MRSSWKKDLVFFVADSASAKAAIGAAAKNKKKVAGLVLIRPSEELTSSKNMHKYGKEACIVKGNENARILEYLESLGALK